MILEDKVLIVSGAGPGLGGEIAKLALRDGARVVLGARNEERLAKLATELDPSGERVAFRATDITDAPQCGKLVATATERFGGLDAIAQVAALDSLFGTVLDSKDEDWERTFATNVLGPVHLVRAAVPALKRRGGGSVVLIGSQATYHPQTPQAAYGSSKGALTSAMFYMAKELGPERIRVNTVVPTWMWGPPVEAYVQWQAKERKVSAEDVVGGITANMPLGEIPADEDVAEAVVFFCSDRARMITGQALLVNSGELMR